MLYVKKNAINNVRWNPRDTFGIHVRWWSGSHESNVFFCSGYLETVIIQKVVCFSDTMPKHTTPYCEHLDRLMADSARKWDTPQFPFYLIWLRPLLLDATVTIAHSLCKLLGREITQPNAARSETWHIHIPHSASLHNSKMCMAFMLMMMVLHHQTGHRRANKKFRN